MTFMARQSKTFRGAGFSVTIKNDRFGIKSKMLSTGLFNVIGKLMADGQAVAQMHAPVRTGVLRASIQHEVVQTEAVFTGRIWTTIEYAIYQEYGTRFNAPHPFMAPAFEMIRSTTPLAMKALARQIENA